MIKRAVHTWNTAQIDTVFWWGLPDGNRPLGENLGICGSIVKLIST